jgi:hypothetical protein
MSACGCSYSGHPKFLATIMVFDDTIVFAVVVLKRIVWCSFLVVEPSGCVLRRFQSVAEVAGNVAILPRRVFHLVDEQQ